ncbi:MAG: phosphoribosyl-AMP cyclohydrolase [Pseudomonadota bacterium]
MQTRWLESIHWDAHGLVPVIAQDWQSKTILMQAFVNREALQLAVQEKRAIYWSRSRKQLWRKGEESGHIQILHEVLLDCDGDSLVYVVEQVGGIACHTGRASCYFHKLGADNEWQKEDNVLKEPAQIYRNSPKD